MIHLRPCWQYFWLHYLLIGFLCWSVLIGLNIETGIFLILLITMVLLIQRYRYLYTITDDYVETRIGIIARYSTMILTDHIRAFQINQGIIGRILNYGSVEFSSAADSGVKIIFNGIQSPEIFRNRIHEIIQLRYSNIPDD